jgi:glutathione peroxidase
VSDLLDLPLTTLQGEPTTLGALTAGSATLVVNVASRCGLTPQYEQLEALQQEYAGRGFTVLGRRRRSPRSARPPTASPSR